MKKLSLTTLLFLAVSTCSWSQQYKTAVGIKGGYPSLGGLDIKHFLRPGFAVEGTIGGFSNTLLISALAEVQKSLPEPTGLDWYVGVGPTLGVTSGTYILSVNGVVGVDYTFQDFPLNLSLDTGPVLSLSPIGFGWGGGLAIRYAFK
ncbi:MAG TPA: hypothetical protein DEF82_00845 [Crocinitomicaceae bacterium]|nr:hypothetical protein [Flavobacteriales bacterium]HBW85329.1 hypothetical protein [Crocinitomicaceae bacterium]